MRNSVYVITVSETFGEISSSRTIKSVCKSRNMKNKLCLHAYTHTCIYLGPGLGQIVDNFSPTSLFLRSLRNLTIQFPEEGNVNPLPYCIPEDNIIISMKPPDIKLSSMKTLSVALYKLNKLNGKI